MKEAILKGREERSHSRKEVINNLKPEHKKFSCLTISINTPGKDKNFKLANDLLREAKLRLYYLFKKNNNKILDRKYINNKAGPFEIIAVKSNPAQLKKFGILLENRNPQGRLFDIDIYDSNNRQLSRSDFGESLRKCIICNKSAKTCIRLKAHSPEDLQKELLLMGKNYYQNEKKRRKYIAKKLKDLAGQAMKKEVLATPKPGLVDQNNNGAHNDMDLELFIKSTNTIQTHLGKFFYLGSSTLKNPKLLNELKTIGLNIEKDMFETTNNINTQKGIIFSFGLIIAAVGKIYKNKNIVNIEKPIQLIAKEASDLIEGITYKELIYPIKNNNKNLTNGQKVYKKYGIKGARGEAEAGFPNVINTSLPALIETLNNGISFNEACIQTLLKLMTVVNDSNILYRADLETLKIIREKAKMILNKGGVFTKKGKNEIIKLDRYMIKNHLSPGGAADLLAVTIYLYLIKTEWEKILNQIYYLE